MVDEELIAARLRLVDARKFIADSLASAEAIKKVSRAADQTKTSVDRGNRSNFAYSQGLYTIRRGAFWATTGLVGLGTAAVVMGFRFNATMESNTLVMTQFLGSARLAHQELGSLFTLAATGPFEFTSLVSSARQFLAFGFTLRETNRDLRILSDTAAGLQLGGAGIEHLVMVFGQIRASGRLLGQDMLQLQQAGINVRGILQRELGLSKAQMTDLAKGTLSIPADTAIEAIMRGLNRSPSAGGFRGLSSRLQGTFTALTATAHDYASQLFGTITHPWFLDAERGLRQLNPLLLAAGRAYKTGGMDALFQTLDRGLGADGRLVASWRDVRAIGQDVNRIVRGALIPAFGALWITLGLGSPPMRILIGLLGLASRHTTTLQILIGVLALRFLYLRGAALAWRIAARLAGTELATLTATTKIAVAAEKLYTIWTLRAELATAALRRSVILLMTSLRTLSLIGTIVIAVELIFHRKGVNDWIRENVPGVGAIQDFSERHIPGVAAINKATGGSVIDRYHKTPQRTQARTVDLGAAIAAKLPPITAAPINIDGKKLAEVTFGWQQTVAARS